MFDKQALRAIIESMNDGLVVIDEAYFAFAEDDCLEWVAHYEQLIIMRTFSKVGFAGLRIGVMIGQPNWLEQINKIRLPYNINNLSQSILAEVLKQPEEFEASVSTIKQQRQILYAQLSTLDGH